MKSQSTCLVVLYEVLLASLVSMSHVCVTQVALDLARKTVVLPESTALQVQGDRQMFSLLVFFNCRATILHTVQFLPRKTNIYEVIIMMERCGLCVCVAITGHCPAIKHAVRGR